MDNQVVSYKWSEYIITRAANQFESKGLQLLNWPGFQSAILN